MVATKLLLTEDAVITKTLVIGEKTWTSGDEEKWLVKSANYELEKSGWVIRNDWTAEFNWEVNLKKVKASNLRIYDLVIAADWTWDATSLDVLVQGHNYKNVYIKNWVYKDWEIQPYIPNLTWESRDWVIIEYDINHSQLQWINESWTGWVIVKNINFNNIANDTNLYFPSWSIIENCSFTWTLWPNLSWDNSSIEKCLFTSSAMPLMMRCEGLWWHKIKNCLFLPKEDSYVRLHLKWKILFENNVIKSVWLSGFTIILRNNFINEIDDYANWSSISSNAIYWGNIEIEQRWVIISNNVIDSYNVESIYIKGDDNHATDNCSITGNKIRYLTYSHSKQNIRTDGNFTLISGNHIWWDYANIGNNWENNTIENNLLNTSSAVKNIIKITSPSGANDPGSYQYIENGKSMAFDFNIKDLVRPSTIYVSVETDEEKWDLSGTSFTIENDPILTDGKSDQFRFLALEWVTWVTTIKIKANNWVKMYEKILNIYAY